MREKTSVSRTSNSKISGEPKPGMTYAIYSITDTCIILTTGPEWLEIVHVHNSEQLGYHIDEPSLNPIQKVNAIKKFIGLLNAQKNVN